MKYRVDGNLAYKISDEKEQDFFSADSLRSSALPEIPYELPEFPQKREAEIEREKRRIERQEAARDIAIRRIHRNVGKEHFKTVTYCIVGITMIACMFAFLMLRQSKIVEQNFQNTRIKNEISDIKKSNSDQYENMLSQINLTEIEAEAFKLYGLRKPAQSQKIHVSIPEVDRVITYNSNKNTLDSDADANKLERRSVREPTNY